MIIYGLSDPGMVRAENQDYYTVTELPSKSLLALVADGMGGVKGGSVASKLAAETFACHLTKNTGKKKEKCLEQALAAANTAVHEKAEEKDGALQGMGTTLVAALLDPKEITLLHVGDSRAYLYREGSVTAVTHDHSYVQQMIDEGRMKAEEAKHSMYRHIITRAVGTAKSVKGDVSTVPWDEGDKLLLCTDGLYGYFEEKELCDILSEEMDVLQAVHELVAAANARGGEDNITALIIENKKETPTDV